jgi:D-alanyl-D-alanine carboxypeptidase
MNKHASFLTIVILLSAALSACAPAKPSIYQGLKETEDAVLDSEIDLSEPSLADALDVEPSSVEMTPEQEALAADLSNEERALITKWHKGQTDKLSFVVVDEDQKLVRRAHLATTPRRLASVTKLPTAISALNHVNGIDFQKVKRMLKSSHNGEASRYLRLAVKAMQNYIVQGPTYSAASSCPSSSVLRNEHPAARIVFDWFRRQIPQADWTNGSLKDGAGCDYGNFLSPLQIVQLLKMADDQGPAFGGQDFEQFLSKSGVDGTWRGRNTDAPGRVLAKTGTLAVSSNLAGYFYANRDRQLRKYYFAILIAKTAAENVSNTRSLSEGLVRHWLKTFSATSGDGLGQLP